MIEQSPNILASEGKATTTRFHTVCSVCTSLFHRHTVLLDRTSSPESYESTLPKEYTDKLYIYFFLERAKFPV